jgi:putative membrane protein
MKFAKILWLFSETSLLLFVMLFPWSQALAQQRSNSGWGMGPGMMGNWGMGWFGMIFMMIFWVLVIVALVFLIKWLIQTTSSRKASEQTGSGAIDILKERYARGEIDKAEFESKKKDLLG